MISSHESYRQYAPHRALRPYVACYWSRVAPAPDAPLTHRVLPDGCMDIIFDFSPGRNDDGKIVGTMTRPLLFEADGPLHMIAVRFRPAGAIPFLRCSAETMTDCHYGLSSAWTAAGRIGQRIRDEVDVARQVRRLESELLMRLGDARPIEPRVRAATAMLSEQGRAVESVARAVDVSRQHLVRLFRGHVGVGPKAFQRVARLQRLLARIARVDTPNWSTTALEAGYYDQAHMIAECRSLARLTPSGIAERSRAVARMFHFSNPPRSASA